jgi:alkaline phosphatase D
MKFGQSQARNLVAVGSIEPRGVRLWARTEQPGRFVLTIRQATAVVASVRFEVAAGNPRDNTVSLRYPDDFPGAPALAPLHRYNFKVESESADVFVGAGDFETAPADAAATPQRFSIGVISCHQPFSSEGELSPRNTRLLEGLPAAFKAHDIKLLISAGDQIYADAPDQFSLTSPHYLKARWPERGQLPEWPADQIRAAYQERYRIGWNQPAWLKLLNAFPNYAILDDHEVFDDWGVKPEHESAPYKKVTDAARMAYLDYQGSRQIPWTDASPLPSALDYRFQYGSVAGFVFDLRSERRAGPAPQVVGPGQLARFESFLAESRGAQVVLVVTSVPLVHIPEWLTAAGQFLFGTKVDFPDHWSAPANRGQRQQLLRTIQSHLQRPETRNQKLIVLGGDVHVGAAFALTLVGPDPKVFYELTTSAVSNRIQDFEVHASVLGPKLFALHPRTADGLLDVRLLPGASTAAQRNPIGGLNAGVLELQRSGDTTNVRFKLLGYGDDFRIREEFISGWL